MNNASLSPGSLIKERCWVSQGIWGTKTCEKLASYLHCGYCPKYNEAASSLLNQPISEAHLVERTEYYSRPRKTTQAHTGSLLVFRLGKEWLGIPPGCVQEVTAQRKIHSIPHRNNSILLGVVNIRGELLLCVSLAGFLGIPINAASAEKPKIRPRWLVISQEGRRLVFPVDEVEDIVTYAENDLHVPPSTLLKGSIHFTSGLLSWQNNQVGCLDMQRLFAALLQHIS